MNVSDIMTRKPVTVHQDATLQVALEMMEQIGVGASDPRCDRFQGHGCGAFLTKQLAGSRDCGSPALFLAQPFANY